MTILFMTKDLWVGGCKEKTVFYGQFYFPEHGGRIIFLPRLSTLYIRKKLYLNELIIYKITVIMETFF